MRAIPPPPPRLVRVLPPSPGSAVIELESARPTKVIELSEPLAGPGRPPLAPEAPWRLGAGASAKGRLETRPAARQVPEKPAEPKEEEADPTLPSNPWAEKRH